MCVYGRQMDDMILLWFWIHVLYTASFTLSLDCTAYQFDTTCSDNCSQSERFKGANDTFFCKIQMQEEGIKMLLENANITIDAPMLMSVDFYYKKYLVNKATRDNPSLNISFQLPDGFFALESKLERKYALKGVHLNFTSVADARGQDVYYHHCPKYRLFNFSTYSPTYYDSRYPRTLTYDCLVGLDENDARVYMIGLQSLPGRGITYYVTTYNQREVWKPAIAISFRNATSLHVVFEQAQFRFNSCRVELFKSDRNSFTPKDMTSVQKIMKLPTDNSSSHIFEVFKGGYYFVQVSFIGNTDKCPNDCLSQSWTINTSFLSFTSAENHSWLDENQGILAAIIGSLAGIMLVILLIYLLWKKKVKTDSRCAGGRKPSVFIVYSFECSEFDNLVQSFAMYIRDKWEIDVYLDLWEETQSQVISADWCSERLCSVEFLLCICSKGWIETFNNARRLSSHRQYCEYIKYAVDKVSEMRMGGQCCPEILTIWFEFMSCTVPTALKNHRSYMLMQSSKKLFCDLHNCTDVPRNFNRAVVGLRRYLQKDIKKAKKFFKSNPNWIEKRIIKGSARQEPTHITIKSVEPPSSPESNITPNTEMKSKRHSPSGDENEYRDLYKILLEINEDPDESEDDVCDHDNKAIFETAGESPFAQPLIYSKNGKSVKTNLQDPHHYIAHSPDCCQAEKTSKSNVSKEQISFLPEQIPMITSQPGDFKHKIHNDLLIRKHYPGSPTHIHHKEHPLPAPQQKGKRMTCSHPISSQPHESALFHDKEPNHSQESSYFTHHKDASPDEYASYNHSLSHGSLQLQSLVNYKEQRVPSVTKCVDTRQPSLLKISECAKHKDIRASTTGKSLVDHANSYPNQVSCPRMQHLNSCKSCMDHKFVDLPQNPYNGHQNSYFDHQNPVQIKGTFMFNQPRSTAVTGLSEERYPLHPESYTNYLLVDEEDREHSFDEYQHSLKKQNIFNKIHNAALSESVPANKILNKNSCVSHPQNNFNVENIKSNTCQKKQLPLLMKGMEDFPEESELLHSQRYPSKILLDTHSWHNCYANTENQSSIEYQINLQHEQIDEEFVPPEDLSGSEGEREYSKPMSQSMESVMEELADLNESDSFEMENDPIERPRSVF